MKSIIKLTLISLAIVNCSIHPNAQLAKELCKAVKKTASKVGCPPGLKPLINNPINSTTNRTIDDLSSELTIDDAGYLVLALLDNFFDSKNNASLTSHMDLFDYTNTHIVKNKSPQLSAFISNITYLKNSTNAVKASRAIKSEIEELDKRLSTGSQQERAFAKKMRAEVTEAFKDRSTNDLFSVVTKRIRLNK